MHDRAKMIVGDLLGKRRIANCMFELSRQLLKIEYKSNYDVETPTLIAAILAACRYSE
jgi:hypothetical protein